MPIAPNIDPQLYLQLNDESQESQEQGSSQESQEQGALQESQRQSQQESNQLKQQEQMQEPIQQSIQHHIQSTQTDDDSAIVDEAKKALGLDELERKIRQQEEMLAKIEAEKARTLMEKKYPNVPFEAVEQEIKKVEKVNPQLAEAMRTNPDAMELAYKAALASIKPQDKPDDITEGEGGGDEGDDIEDAIKKGEADDFMLGEWILKGA